MKCTQKASQQPSQRYPSAEEQRRSIARLNGVLGQHGAVELYRREVQERRKLAVLDRLGSVQRPALYETKRYHGGLKKSHAVPCIKSVQRKTLRARRKSTHKRRQGCVEKALVRRITGCSNAERTDLDNLRRKRRRCNGRPTAKRFHLGIRDLLQ
jgi:hypothetical protein